MKAFLETNATNMRRVRFATAIPHFSRGKGGAERYLADLCSQMAYEDFEVHVYAEHWDEEIQEIDFHPVRAIPFPKSLRLLSFAVRATREMTKAHYDVTLGVGNTLAADVLQPHGGVHWAWFWRSLRAYENPFLRAMKLFSRVLSPKQWIQGTIENAPYKGRKFHKIVAISDMVKQDIVQWYGIPKDQIEVIYNGIDTERFHPRNRQYREEIRKRHGIGNEFLILFVSNNFGMKGLGHLIKALAAIKKGPHPPLKLVVLGRDRQAPYLRLARKMRISEAVVFAGSTGEPEKYYGAADLLVHPTFYDACSLTVLEALASGLPVITTVSNGASGLLRQATDGWVIDDLKKGGSLEEAIRYFFDEKVREQVAKRGREKAESHDRKVNFNQMIGVLREAARNK